MDQFTIYTRQETICTSRKRGLDFI